MRLSALEPALVHIATQLQPRDRDRLAEVRTEKRRRELLGGRWLLRSFARHLGLAGLVFDSAEDHAGVAVSGLPRTTASIAHAGGWIACALASGDVGVDIEPLTERDFLPLTREVFPALEQALARLSPEDRTVEFYRLWTCREAKVKNPDDRHRCVSWLLPAQWVLSVRGERTDTARPPIGWNERDGRFEALPVQRLHANR